ncbi:hypothetical protein [Fodinicola feengrottensis]|uniref:hypothetical protein n=1 Tax=Fodinicola feengrottensis TaxID=435914 RepID=UPI0013D3E7AB|nr:hypothetical protein [Fodinicola feengrottensis]
MLAALVFALGTGVVVGVELVGGGSLTSILHGKPDGGTSIGGGSGTPKRPSAAATGSLVVAALVRLRRIRRRASARRRRSRPRRPRSRRPARPRPRRAADQGADRTAVQAGGPVQRGADAASIGFVRAQGMWHFRQSGARCVRRTQN